MVDGMAALTSAIILQDIEPAEERVALAFMSSVISGPIAYALPIVRRQRERENRETQPVTGTRPRPRAGPALAEVPHLVREKRDRAIEILEGLHLKAKVDLHESPDTDRDIVIAQDPVEGKMLTVGSRVTLSVGDGPAPPREETLTEVLRGLRDELVELRAEVHKLRPSHPPAAK